MRIPFEFDSNGNVVIRITIEELKALSSLFNIIVKYYEKGIFTGSNLDEVISNHKEFFIKLTKEVSK